MNCWFGLDMAGTTDLASLAMLFWDDDDERCLLSLEALVNYRLCRGGLMTIPAVNGGFGRLPIAVSVAVVPGGLD